MRTQQLFIPINLPCKPQALNIQKPYLAIFACAFMLSYADTIQADTKTKDTETMVKTKSKIHKKASGAMVKAKSKAGKNEIFALTEVIVTTKKEDMPTKNSIGVADSASQGEVSQALLEYRPLSRNGELVEVVPGAVATQHSGSGKANQYFLRGFNLDHGTDFTTYVDGIPMNMPSHAHGQGYMDINSVIPELVKND